MVGVYVLPATVLADGSVCTCCLLLCLQKKVGVYLLPVALLAESGCLHVLCYSGRRRVDVYMLPVTLLAGG